MGSSVEKIKRFSAEFSIFTFYYKRFSGSSNKVDLKSMTSLVDFADRTLVLKVGSGEFCALVLTEITFGRSRFSKSFSIEIF